MNADPKTVNPAIPEVQLDRTTYHLKTPMRVSGRQLKRGDAVVTIERPRGLRVSDVLNIIRTGQAVDRRIC